jgi:hypothetical protein
MTEYTVEPDDRCSACGSPAVIIYRQRRDAKGDVSLRIPHDVTCSNPRCVHCPPLLRTQTQRSSFPQDDGRS